MHGFGKEFGHGFGKEFGHGFGKFLTGSVVLYKGTPHKVLSVTTNGWHELVGVAKKVRTNDLKAIAGTRSPSPRTKKATKRSPKKTTRTTKRSPKKRSPKKTTKRSQKRQSPVYDGSDLITEDGTGTRGIYDGSDLITEDGEDVYKFLGN